MYKDLQRALTEHAPATVADVLSTAEAGILQTFEVALPDALGGAFDAISALATAWDALLTDLVEARARLLRSRARRAKAATPVDPQVLVVLRACMADAPFTRFVGAFGGRGLAVACVADVRQAFPELEPLVPGPGPLGGLGPAIDVLRFRRLADLAVRGLAPPLERVQEALGLPDGETGAMFGVSRQAVVQWRQRGVPSDRWPRLADLVAVTDLLERKLRAGRLPLVARRPTAAFGGRTLLEMVSEGRHAELRDIVERSLDWSTTA